jgi:uncharacterized repeat protein (TIGR01451 family)
MYDHYHQRLWGLYGLKDSLNARCEPYWFDNDYIGIDVGAMLLTIENYRSNLVWNTFMRNGEITTAMEEVGFVPDYTNMLDVIKQADLSIVRPGEQLTYTICVTNTGNMTLTATITDTLPDHVTPGNTRVWTATVLAPGGVWTQAVVVTVNLGYSGILTNAVEVNTVEGATGSAEAIVHTCYGVYLPLVLRQFP